MENFNLLISQTLLQYNTIQYKYLCDRPCANVEIHVFICVPAHHQGLDQDVFDEFEVIALELLALSAGSLHFFIRIKTKELGFIFELTLLQDLRGKTQSM